MDDFKTGLEPEAGAGKPAALWSWKDVGLVSLASVLCILAGAFGLSRLTGLQASQAVTAEGPSLAFNALLAAVETLALVSSVYLFGLRRKGIGWHQVGLRVPPAHWLWSAAMLALIFIPLMGLIALLIQWILGLPLENPQMPFLAPKNFSWAGATGMVLLGGLAVPFAEELFFRGVLYRWLRDRWGFWTGLLVSSLVFGLLHGDVSVAGATFVMGLALAWIYERSQSLWPSIIIHALNNSLKLVLLYTLIATGMKIPGIQ